MDKTDYSAISTAVSLALQFAITVIAMVFLGWLTDDWLGTSPLFMLVFAVLGFVTALYSLYKRVMISGS